MCDRDVRMHANKLFEFSDLPAVAASPRFHSLKNFVDRLTDQGIACTTRGTLQSTNLNDPTTWYRHTLHYLRAWEYVRILEVLAIPQHAAVLDVGGAATPFLFYLAEELSCRIVTVDLQQELVEHTRCIAERRGWDITACCGNIADFTAGMKFDFAISVSVFEHMPAPVKQKAISVMAHGLKEGGLIGLSFDFGQLEKHQANASGATYAPFKSWQEISASVIAPSGCTLLADSFAGHVPADMPVTVKPSCAGWPLIPYFPFRISLLRQLIYRPLGYTFGTVFLKK